MKNIIEIKIECKGNAVGTLGWFNSIMQGSEFIIKNCKSGEPGLFLKHKNKDSETMSYSFICKKWNQNQDPEAYRIRSNDYLIIYPLNSQYLHGFSDYPLTQACELKVEEMIQIALDKFAEWWENDK